MKRVYQMVFVALVAAQAITIGQGGDAAKLLASVRAALGGEDKIAAVKTLAASGRSTRVSESGSSPATDFEIGMELPDKFYKKDTIGVVMGSTLTRTAGFNGDGLIEIMDTPPAMGGGGNVQMFRVGPGMTSTGGQSTPEQTAEQHKASLVASKQEFARLVLGMFATSYSPYPLEFGYGGQAQSPEGTVDIITVKGSDDFSGKLFVHATTHLPLMLSWMAKEPLRMSRVMTGSTGSTNAGGMSIMTSSGQGQPMTPEQRQQMMQDLQNRMKEAEANLKTVEYRVYYGDYKDAGKEAGGVKLPFKLQRSIDGQLTEELAFEKFKVNQKIDPKKFQVTAK
jgi:hypothetical protein